ncbi:MAG: SDR family NAD(P)-dependent oxidoreductase [Betaproteobacteria bacterium]|nr:SDR family oxidoreductase [Betaproteobacteria bacterium]
MQVSYDFSGNVVLIAGAGSGLGLAMTHSCLAAGAQVVASDIVTDALARIEHPGLTWSKLDITDSRAVAAHIKDCAARFGRIDAAVLASGIQRRILVEDMRDEDWLAHINVNLNGVFFLVRALFPEMKQRRRGSILVFTSGLATAGWPGATAYGASKAALIALVKSAAQELRPHGVRINAVSPGIMHTPLFHDSANQDEVRMYERSLGVSQPEDVTPLLMHLISDGASTVSGNVVERRLIPQANP